MATMVLLDDPSGNLDVNLREYSADNTALHYASGYNRTRVVGALLKVLHIEHNAL